MTSIAAHSPESVLASNGPNLVENYSTAISADFSKRNPSMFHEGGLIPHSIIGSVDDFQNASNSDIPVRSASGLVPVPRPPSPVLQPESEHEAMQRWHEQRQLRHFKNWETTEKKWKRQQEYLQSQLAGTTKRSGLCMESLSAHRKLLEAREKMDIVLSDPAVMPQNECGKGYRVRTEWWAQGEVRSKSQLRTTLPRHAQPGTALACDTFEYIGRPTLGSNRAPSSYALVDGASSDDGGDGVSDDPFARSDYFKARSGSIAQAIQEHFPHTPQTAELAVVGRAIAPGSTDGATGSSVVDLGRGCGIAGVDVLLEDETQTSSPRHSFDDGAAASPGFPTDILGDVTGPQLRCYGNEPADAGPYVTFVTPAGQRQRQTLTFENLGTTVLFLQWYRHAQQNDLGVHEAVTQRFFFDSQPLVLLPGDCRTLPVDFMSGTSGVFLSTWGLTVSPALTDGSGQVRTPVVSMCGTAVAADKLAPGRQHTERTLEHRAMQSCVRGWLFHIIDRLPTRPARCREDELVDKPPSTLAERFQHANATLWDAHGLAFCDATVARLQSLHQRVHVQQWAALAHPAPIPSPGHQPPDPKGGKKSGAGDTATDGVDEEIPEIPPWDLSLVGLKKTILQLDDAVMPVTINGYAEPWLSAHAYLDLLNQCVLALSATVPRPQAVSRKSTVREVLARMVGALSSRCALGRQLQGLPEMPVVLKPPIQPEVYVPRMPINPPIKGAKKGKAPPAKDKGKDTAKTDGEQPTPLPQLDPAAADELRVLQCALAREVVAAAMDELCTLLPVTRRDSTE
eukprot:m.364726 g.364726  ORF g.364726 m.364726 type:complete len:795 (-) comp20808_c0_seq58:611-2995(-)